MVIGTIANSVGNEQETGEQKKNLSSGGITTDRDTKFVTPLEFTNTTDPKDQQATLHRKKYPIQKFLPCHDK